MEEKNARAREQARAQYEFIEGLIRAYDVEWDRLGELREARDDFVEDRLREIEGETKELAIASWRELNPDDAQELEELEKIAGEYDSQAEVYQMIKDDPLEVSVRSGWGSPYETLEPEEYRILLCTGGPAVQITGDLGGRWHEPQTARLEFQDWFTWWEEFSDGVDESVLLRYASFFLEG